VPTFVSRLKVVQLQNDLVRSDELEKLRHQFVALFEDHVTGLNEQNLRFPPRVGRSATGAAFDS
jgi:hypothetical protein